ncbi:hypothetical protein EV177_003110 [Coemansia sp. RSA 1804]|nr:hypothetical protein EV177_003110 [Coemansia sp. RSA 1804]
MSVINYIAISTQALSSIFFIGATGYFLKLGPRELQVLARINVSVFTPSLLFSKISRSLDRETLYDLWLIPILYLVLGAAGLEWTRLGGRFFGLTDAFRRLCSVAVYFSNVNTILIPIIEGIAASPDSRFLLRDRDDTPQKMADRAIAYGMIIGIMNNLLRWSVGVAMMTPPKSGDNEHTDLLAEEAARTSSSAVSRSTASEHVRLVCTRIWNAARQCLTPPLCAVVVALLVVLVPPLQHALLQHGSYTYCVWMAIDTCGQACIPATLLALGAQLAIKRSPEPQSSQGISTTERYVSERDQNRGIVLVVLGRFVVVPLCCCIVLLSIHRFAPWLVPLLRADPMLFLTLAIVSATPPAVNLLTVAQKVKMYEGESARILSYSYAIGMFVLSVEVSVFLYLASLLSSGA